MSAKRFLTLRRLTPAEHERLGLSPTQRRYVKASTKRVTKRTKTYSRRQADRIRQPSPRTEAQLGADAIRSEKSRSFWDLVRAQQKMIAENMGLPAGTKTPFLTQMAKERASELTDMLNRAERMTPKTSERTAIIQTLFREWPADKWDELRARLGSPDTELSWAA